MRKFGLILAAAVCVGAAAHAQSGKPIPAGEQGALEDAKAKIDDLESRLSQAELDYDKLKARVEQENNDDPGCEPEMSEEWNPRKGQMWFYITASCPVEEQQ